MRKYKANPKKPGWYLAWLDGKLNCFDISGNEDYQNKRNHLYWDGFNWYLNEDRLFAIFMIHPYNADRWSYIPKVS